MKKNLIAYIIFVFAFDSCSQKFYIKNDYSFYNENFELSKESLLKTNGIYVLESTWSSVADNSNKEKQMKSFYIFHKTGQSNMIMMSNTDSVPNYRKIIIDNYNRSKKNKNIGTLFQGYYLLRGNKIIIENVNSALRRFNYSYGYVENDKLIIVKPNSLQGDGKFEDKYFLQTYKETYLFVPVEDLDSVLPNW
ncbi:hypothetical protein FIA58_020405 [Flavobacterium jejuense]|uniref:LPS export ABC transporter periplasmic protein LptC n=1 Tax=Flavobacterium jejuense TaxID=1544455 RepID=A0ABX0IZC6_9FLAO|nr:hypothetical protein [Flavobacterium jejuense]NHN28047.1 hypothetical protein [Flavobacterium jejuense]